MSDSNCCFLTCIQISQEADRVVWYSHLFQNFPQFIVIHTVKAHGIVNKAEVDVFLELFCCFDDPMDVGNLIFGSSAFSKSSRSPPPTPNKQKKPWTKCKHQGITLILLLIQSVSSANVFVRRTTRRGFLTSFSGSTSSSSSCGGILHKWNVNVLSAVLWLNMALVEKRKKT